MIHSDVDKSTMPDGSALLPDTLHTEVLVQQVNGDQESPVGILESPEDKGIIRCICGFDDDDGFTIFCERCSVWQHGACVGVYDAKDAPDKYLCDLCNPRDLDVQKAIRHQQQRREAELNNHKPKRRTSGHPKSKPSLGITPNLAPPPNRKEKHPSPPRRTEGKRPRAAGRGQSAIQVETVVQEEVDVVNDEDADVPFWLPTDNYDHREQNEITPGIRQLLERQLQQLESIPLGDLSPDFERMESIRSYTRKTLRQPVSKQSTPAYSNFVRQFGLFAAEPMNENELITDFVGRIGFQQDYKKDMINQYSALRHPKQYVLFSPPNTLDIYVDARLYGNDARYVRRSCFPNARVALVLVSNSTERGIHFGLFATKNIKTREEITISHEWNMSHKIEEMIAAMRDETRPLLEVYAPETIRNMAAYAPAILVNGECACHEDHCVFTRLRKASAALPDASSRHTSIVDGDAMSIDGMQRSDDLEGSEIDEDSRTNSPGTQKPISRDRTPSKDSIFEGGGPQTAREQRKIEQAMARFAQMEEKEREKSTDRRKKSDPMDIDDSLQSGISRRRRQGSITTESVTRPSLQRMPSTKVRGIKRKSMSPSPGVDRVSESGTSLNESPQPGGRVPNRVKRTMKGRKEPSNKRVRLQPPGQNAESSLPKWVIKTTLSASWTPPQLLWYKKYAENAKREYEQTLKECRESEIVVLEKPPESVDPTTVLQATPPPPDTAAKGIPNLRVAMPTTPCTPALEQMPMTQTPTSTATPLQPSTSYFPSSALGTSIMPLASPVGTPSTPKAKISLAEYRARRASGMATSSTSTMSDTLTLQPVGEGFTIPPQSSSQTSKSPHQKPAEPPMTS